MKWTCTSVPVNRRLLWKPVISLGARITQTFIFKITNQHRLTNRNREFGNSLLNGAVGRIQYARFVKELKSPRDTPVDLWRTLSRSEAALPWCTCSREKVLLSFTEKKNLLCTFTYWSLKDFPPGTSCQELSAKKTWLRAHTVWHWFGKRKKKPNDCIWWSCSFGLPHSFFLADFFFSSLTSWLGSLRLTSGSVWVRLAGIMSNSRSL